MTRNYDFERFVTAQNPVYETVLAELASGHKTSHWMWYVFPQLLGLGHSQQSQFYGIVGKAEATAYLAHPVLNARLIECTALAMQHAANGATQLFGPVDELKFQSSMSLFSRVKGSDPIFRRALDVFYGGVGDTATLKVLKLEFIASLDE